jgi:hypothetical protein
METSMADSDTPDFSIWTLGQKPIRGVQGIFCQGIQTAQHIDGDNLPAISRLHFGLDSAFVQRIPQRSDFLRGGGLVFGLILHGEPRRRDLCGKWSFGNLTALESYHNGV